MRATTFEFRFRYLIFVLLYLVGFFAPWTWTSGHYGPPADTAWLAIPTLLARWGWTRLDVTSLLVTWLAILLAVAGAVVRVWGTAYLSAGVVESGLMHGDRVMASGPYRYVRNPLYLGAWFLALSVAILMPPSGAVVFLVALGLFYFRLILGEEAFLAAQAGESYLDFKRRVPRLLPSLRARIPSSGAPPQWLTSLIAETLPVAWAIALGAFAWRYEPHLLVRCLLICFGLSVITRAFLPKKPAVAE